MFCAVTIPVPVAVTDFGEMCPVIVFTCVSVNERAGSWGIVDVVVVVGLAVVGGVVGFVVRDDDAARASVARVVDFDRCCSNVTIATSAMTTASTTREIRRERGTSRQFCRRPPSRTGQA